MKKTELKVEIRILLSTKYNLDENEIKKHLKQIMPEKLPKKDSIPYILGAAFYARRLCAYHFGW